MFTGIIEKTGVVRVTRFNGAGAMLTVTLPNRWKVREGESLSVNGVCLTVTKTHAGQATFDCMAETLRCTTLSELKPKDVVNLERPLTLNAAVGGHLVQGHVDGVGVIKSIKKEGESKILRIGVLEKLARHSEASEPFRQLADGMRASKEQAFSQKTRHFIEKGSVTVEGVSLTIVDTFKDGFSVALIPLTQKATTLGRKSVGQRVNIEVDLIVKTVDAMLRRGVKS